MKKIYKEIILGIAVVLLSVFCWWVLKYAFYNGSSGISHVWLGLTIFVLFGVALCLAMLLIKNKFILFGSFGLALLLFFIFFNNKLIYYSIALIIFFGVFSFAANRIKKEEEVQVTLNFWRIWKRGLPWLITALCLIIATIYYFSPGAFQPKQAKINLPPKIINLIITPIQGLIKEKLPKGVSLDSKIGQIIPPEQWSEMEKQLGVKINKNDTGKDVIYKVIDFQIRNALGSFAKFIPLGIAIGLFISLKLVSLIYVPIVVLLSWLILKLLMFVKFVRVERETKEVETVVL
jgi:hypothetical protein